VKAVGMHRICSCGPVATVAALVAALRIQALCAHPGFCVAATGTGAAVAVAAFELWPALEFASATAELRTGVRQ